ncbi:MAG: hypothetical protein NXH95_14340 [Pseudomonadaceae bacterium]|nr:hypothetical protein [Pseudomonadaceae bacterium]
MPFTEPLNDAGDAPKKLDWLLTGHMMGTFFFKDSSLVSTVRYGIMPSNLSSYLITGFVGDGNFEDDLFNMESFEPPLQQVAPAKRWLSLFLIPRERDGKDFDFSVVFFSDKSEFPNQEYEFKSDGNPIGLRIPIKFVQA